MTIANNPPQASHHRQVTFAMLLALFCGFSLALLSLFGKYLITDTNITNMILLRFIAPAIILLWIGLISQTLVIRLVTYKEFIWRAFFAVAAQYSFFFYLAQTTIFNATTLFCTNALFVPIISYFFHGTTIKKRTQIAIVISFIGVICIVQPSTSIFHHGALIGLAAGFFNACAQVSTHQLSRKYSSLEVAFYMYSLGAVMAALPWLLLSSHHDFVLLKSNLLSLSFIGILIAYAVVSINNQVVRASAYRLVNKPATLGPFIYSAIIFSAILDWLFFDKLPNLLAIIGAILIIFGGCAMLFFRQQK